ncbi:hypothetical protein IAQ61_007470 [Plenodomus lingam]|uniref:CENP-V/GFA domain-containing protein n=1 Tax=Leptosphaeria maculans (strain JN3 / isolate v23.1.3 / race Av1-4-5-6-7-8) TaxID=985895 RepID=E5A5M1_LEPMJ|nr:hypothetical protein LEMA_P081580.1 [Plenodomus lingam JN3]KAH9866881.1 hypothetical protein IAQ61_007470 [Plenodomus lingam]CBX98919.1 hypothetical protein LEMA_P081580.1 [Plenodomus lingam JN3]
MSAPKRFPSVTGSCVCGTVRYRLLTSPLYCYACHCADCQKSSGSAFGLLLNIEVSNIRIISETTPVAIVREKKPGRFDRHVECPKCKVALWSNNIFGEAVADLYVGTLDYPSLMEPDLHMFVDTKLDWVILPEGTKTVPKDYDPKAFWPKSSLNRLELCLKTAEEMKEKKQTVTVAATAAAAAAVDSQNGKPAANHQSRSDMEAEETSGEGEKTPTAVEYSEKEVDDDEAFEEKFKETEKVLQERLERLRLKLEEQELTKKMRETTIE